MRRIAVAATLGVAGCIAVPDGPPPPPLSGVARTPLRNADAPIASQVDATLARLHGQWHVVAHGGAGAPRSLFGADSASFVFDAQRHAVTALGNGRFKARKSQYWVHWIDGDNRVALIGTPDGGAVWIMQRGARSPDRIAAAWEIFDWYGYNRNRMESGQ